MWSREYETVCDGCDDLVAVYESAEGKIALLLRQTLTPESGARTPWFAETRRAARGIMARPRAAGLDGHMTVLQWRPLAQVARIVGTWRRCYDGNPRRRAELADVALASLGRWTALPPGPPRRQQGRLLAMFTGRELVSPAVITWYRNMTPCWLEAVPATRRALVLRTHRWIVDRVLAPDVSHDDVVRDLTMSGRLARVLARTIPHGEFPRWKHWIALALRDLNRAVAWPDEQRSEAWVRWLFLIPYSIPVTAPRQNGVAPARSGLARNGVTPPVKVDAG